MTGRTVSHFQILEKIGEGGMGEVYKARDITLDRLVAIKFLPPEATRDSERRRRFLQEARAASALNHPNIITIHEIAEIDGGYFIVMEYVHGRTLGAVIAAGKLSVEQALSYAGQAADALAKAHAAGITHRDIKPANIMITATGLVKVLDFGLAKLTASETSGETAPGDSLTQPGMVLGTAAYMSPEQAEGKPAGARSDIFSFGAVLYEMITGRRAFQRESVAAMLVAVMREDPPPPRTLTPAAPAVLDEVLARCLAKDPARRYASMEEVKAALAAPARAPTRDAGPSIAVLPFTNLSADKEQEYFSDGLAEEILNALSQVRGLRVMARASSFSFRGREQDVRKIGRELNVATILEGSVRRAGNRVRITVQLVDVLEGYQLWSERYDREMTDIFAIQDEISQTVVDKLRVQLVGKAQEAARRTAPNLEAYQLLLKGRYEYYRYSPESLAQSMQCARRAIALDAGYAEAYELFGMAHYAQIIFGLADPALVLPEATLAVRRALDLDDSLGEAHGLLGALSALTYDWNESRRQFSRGLELSPTSAMTLLRYAVFYLFPWRRLEEGLSAIARSVELDPVRPLTQAYYAVALHLTGNEWSEVARRAQDLGANLWLSHYMVAECCFGEGNFEEASRLAKLAWETSGGVGWALGLYGLTEGMVGLKQRAREVLDQLREISRSRYVATHSLAMVHLGLGERDLAFETLERAIDRHEVAVSFLRVMPSFAGFRSDPRYQSLLRKMRLEG